MMTDPVEDITNGSVNLKINEEEAEVKYKAALAVVTKKRKKYPMELSKSLGYTMRLQKNDIESMNVNLASQNPLEEPEDSCLVDEMQYDDLNYSLDKLMSDVQVLNSKLKKITSATEILQQNPKDPLKELMEALSNI